jgi:hypothetical protein
MKSQSEVVKRLSSAIVACVALGSFQLARGDDAVSSAEAVDATTQAGTIHGITRGPRGTPLASVKVLIHGNDGTADRTVVSGEDGAFYVADLKPGHYQLTASREGSETALATAVELFDRQSLVVDILVGATVTSTCPACKGNFFQRLGRAYWDDWHPGPDTGGRPKYRGYPMPVSNPPFPFNVWPIGGTVWIGYPNATAYPLTTALQNGKHGDWWKKANVQLYGWVDLGMNISTSHDGPYANAPAAYAQVANSFVLNQFTFYIERTPDTVQTDHFDWGFRLTNLYGFDYRFTTANGYFSQQLLNNPKANGTIGNKYGYDPVMAYLDLYFPKVGQGMDVRIGRYISLPDIEAQLAPNNYTYSHSLTYTYDCYTQTGINATIKWSNHWTTQFGLSAGCEAAPWAPDRKLTGNACLGYSWSEGRDNLYVCANSINDGRYNYNNLAAYYATWYHKFGHSRWHASWETWYQYMSHTPNVLNPNASSLLLTNSNGAVCNDSTTLTCFAPDWATVSYIARDFGKRDFVTVRNEYFNDMRGQRTGYRTKYSEHLISWNRWVGSTIVFRPELRYEHAYDSPAYDSGLKKSQLMFAADVIFFF